MTKVYFIMNELNKEDLRMSIEFLKKGYEYLVEDMTYDTIILSKEEFNKIEIKEGDIFIDLCPNSIDEVDDIHFNTVILDQYIKDIIAYKGSAREFYFMTAESDAKGVCYFKNNPLTFPINSEIEFYEYLDTPSDKKDSLKKKLFFVKYGEPSTKIVFLSNHFLIKLNKPNLIEDEFKEGGNNA